MEFEKIKRIMNYPFYKAFLKDKNIKKFLSNLRAFNNEDNLSLKEQDIEEIEEYFKKRETALIKIRETAQKFKQAVSEGNVDGVYHALNSFITHFKYIRKAEAAFNPASFNTITKAIYEMLLQLESTKYPPDKLREIKQKLTNREAQ